MSTSKPSSKRSKETTKAPKKADVDAPFDAAILRKAREIVSSYRFIIRPSEKLGYVASILELPLVFTDGKTQEQCLKNAMFGAETAIASMLEADQTPPLSSNRRTEQINIRLTSEEKLILEEESQRKGYKGLSDFVRDTALAEVSTGLRK